MLQCHPLDASPTSTAERIDVSDPLKPSVSLLVKIGSIAVHADEILSPSAHSFDRHALQTLFDDEEVKTWLGQMNKMAMLPVKR